MKKTKTKRNISQEIKDMTDGMARLNPELHQKSREVVQRRIKQIHIANLMAGTK